MLRAAPRAKAQDSVPAAQRWASQRAALYQRGDTMVAEAILSGDPVTVLVFEQVDLPELHAIFGGAAAHALVASFSTKLALLAGPRGVALRTDATSWAVLLPGHDEERALAAVRNTMGQGLAVEADTGEDEDETLLVPRLALHTVGQRVAPLRAIYRELQEKIQRAHALELRRQEYLRRERESHSRPASLTQIRGLAPAMR